MVGIEGIGEAVTGGLMARAVEPSAGEHAHAEGANCLNCGAELVGTFCHRCGQKGHVHRTLSAFWHDLVHSVFHFEGKIWRTLPMLAWRPGELTRRYAQGERANFVSPVALFLFSVFLMFAVFSFVGGPFLLGNDSQTSVEARAEAERDFAQEQAENRARLQRLRVERQQLVQAGQSTREVDMDIRRSEQRIALEERLFRQTLDLIATDEQNDARQAQRTRQRGQTESGEDAAVSEVDEALAEEPGLSWLNSAWGKAKENPALLAYKLQTNAYKFSWALIPISVPFLWLLFLHRRRYREYRAYDHVVFITYSIAFMSLGLIVLSLLRPLGLPAAAIGIVIAIVPPYHIYRQLRGAYQLSRFSALWRTLVLVQFAFVAMFLFFLLLVAIGALG